MLTFRCRCGNRLFFDNSQCLKCHRRVTRCPECFSLTATEDSQESTFSCHHCDAVLQRCLNDLQYSVCNLAVSRNDAFDLCRFCRLNSVIPDISIDGNISKWHRLEQAKHRVLEIVQRVGLPIGGPSSGLHPELSFCFKSSGVEPVSTGHAHGRITIDIAEADSAYREQVRVQFGEPQRTLVGHFRHELGHYYWDLLVKQNRLDQFREIFGDETDPDYSTAQQRYYAEGPIHGWPGQYISAYASMHPWEDFAESFVYYLDMRSVLLTASHFQLISSNQYESLPEMVDQYRQVGLVVNELNRDMGLLDLVPKLIAPPIRRKVEFIHRLTCDATQLVGPCLAQG